MKKIDQKRVIEHLIGFAEENMGFAYWSFGVADEKFCCSESMNRMFHLNNQDETFILEDFLDQLKKVDRDRFQSSMTNAIDLGKHWEFVLTIEDGERSKHLVSFGLPVIKNEETIEVVGIFQDITEQQQLQIHHRLLVEAINNINEGIIITDVNGKTVWVNRGIENITGYSLEELRNKKPGKILRGKDTDPETKKIIRNKIRSAESFNINIKNYSKGGKPYWMNLAIHPQVNENKEITHFIAVESDLSALLETQKQLEENKILLEEEIEKRKELETQLQKRTLIDPVVNLPNRRYFYQQLDQELGRVKRALRPLSIVMMDIDHFQRINEVYGRGAGDMALQSLGKFCSEQLRNHDFIARIGGEEFCIIMPETIGYQARGVANRLRKKIEEIVVHYDEYEFSFTCSMGITQCDLTDSQDSLLRRADEALYEAKRLGRNQVVLENE